jgi:hypothetical protein
MDITVRESIPKSALTEADYRRSIDQLLPFFKHMSFGFTNTDLIDLYDVKPKYYQSPLYEHGVEVKTKGTIADLIRNRAKAEGLLEHLKIIE